MFYIYSNAQTASNYTFEVPTHIPNNCIAKNNIMYFSTVILHVSFEVCKIYYSSDFLHVWELRMMITIIVTVL